MMKCRLSNVTRRSALVLAVVATAAPLTLGSFASAQSPAWPKQITIVVPFPPGASNDTLARLLAQKLGPKLNVTVIVDNKPGAGGSIGANFVARAKPDGATLMLTSSTFIGNSAVVKDLPYDAVTSFTPVLQLAKGPLIVAVSPRTPYQSVAELVAAAKAAPGKINYGTAGVGSINHMASEMFAGLAKIEMTHVPYKGSSQSIQDLMGGQIEVVIASLPSFAGNVKGGKVRALAVTSAARSAVIPELPPAAEVVPGYDIGLWWGIFGPAGMAADYTRALNTEIQAILAEADIKERLAAEGAEPAKTSPEEFAGIVKAELAKLKALAEERGIKPE